VRGADLDPTECELLARVANGDDLARRVLADHWIARGDETRGTFVHLQHAFAERSDDAELAAAQHETWQRDGERWRALVVDAGFPRDQLVMERGLLRTPLAFPAGDPIDGAPDLFRLSPRVYRELRTYRRAGHVTTYVATEGTLDAHGPRVLLVASEFDEPEIHAELDERIFAPRPIGRALRRRSGIAIVVPWPGMSLHVILQQARMRDQPLGARVALAIAALVLERLDEVHGRWQCFRWLSTRSIFLDGERAALCHLDDPVSRRVSDSYQRRAPVGYMSPEQVRGLRLDPRTDVFSLATVTCHLASNRHPAGAQANDLDMLVAIRDRAFEIPAFPPPLDAVIERALSQDPEGRYASAADFRTALLDAARRAGLDIGAHVIAGLSRGIPSEDDEG
jgi:hypothetical protein